jgi:thymidylate synthase
MYSNSFKNSREAYLALISKVMTDGVKKSPRGLETREITNVMVQCANPRERMVSFQHGGSHPVYPYVEGLWMLLSEDRHERLTHYSRFPAQFVNPKTGCMDGAYGTRIAPQLPKMYQILNEDKDSRRAVMNIFDFEKDTDIHSFDTPCTMFFHFMIRNEKLDMTIYIRSQDLIKGFPNDSCEFQ